MKKLKYPPHVQWEVTSECNHNCIHCYNYWRRDDFKCKQKTFHPVEHYLEIADKLIKQKANTVVITGGEPFLVFDKIIPAIDKLIAKGIKVSINTNAVLANDKIINYLIKNGIRLFISFPSANPEICDRITNTKGSSERIKKSLNVLMAAGVKFNLNIVVSKINIDDVENTVKFLKSAYDIKSIYITRVGKPVNSDDSFNQYLLDRNDIERLQNISVKLHKELDINVDTSCPYTPCSITNQDAFDLFGYKKMCSAGKTTYSIGFDGAVKACPRDGKSYGDILTDDFDEIWNRMEEWRDGSLIPEECKGCSAKSICLGGCRVDGYPMTGKMNSMDSIANPKNIPVKFKFKGPKKVDFSKDDKFAIVPKLKYVPEDFGYRISKTERYLYITKEFKEFLEKNKEFCLRDIEDAFDMDYQTANDVVNRLVYYNIIIKN